MDGEAVIRTIVADEAFAEEHYPGAWHVVEYQEEFIVRIPDSCSPAQGLVALYVLKNITEQDINSTIDAITDPVVRYTTKIAFSRATTWQRFSPTMAQMGEILGLTNEDLDSLFSFAVTVEV